MPSISAAELLELVEDAPWMDRTRTIHAESKLLMAMGYRMGVVGLRDNFLNYNCAGSGDHFVTDDGALRQTHGLHWNPQNHYPVLPAQPMPCYLGAAGAETNPEIWPIVWAAHREVRET